MNEEELKQAIQRPLFQLYPKGEKRFEEALVERLARDAAGHATYLPLLQVTLEDLWDRGSLKLSAYGMLTDAIQRRVENFYTYEDYASAQSLPRPDADRATIMQIFLDLVDISLDDDTARDVRRRRAYGELVRGSPDRARLVEELSNARLLSRSLETRDGVPLEMVDIIHESLIHNWDRLRNAIDVRRQVLRRRARFELSLREWLMNDRAEDYLLDGGRLADAEELERRGDIALLNPTAQDFLTRSRDRHESATRRELAIAENVLTLHKQLRRIRLAAAVLLALLMLALAALFFSVPGGV